MSEKRRAAMRYRWFALTDRRWPVEFWFDVAWQVKTKRIPKNDLERVKRVIEDTERLPHWRRLTSRST